MHIQVVLFSFIFGLTLIRAAPITLAPNPLVCAVDNTILNIFTQSFSSAALSFCSSYISVPEITSTAAIITVTAPATTTMTNATYTPSTTKTVSVTSCATVYKTVSSIPKRTAMPLDVATPIPTLVRVKRTTAAALTTGSTSTASSFQNAIAGLGAGVLSQACSCVSGSISKKTTAYTGLTTISAAMKTVNVTATAPTHTVTSTITVQPTGKGCTVTSTVTSTATSCPSAFSKVRLQAMISSVPYYATTVNCGGSLNFTMTSNYTNSSTFSQDCDHHLRDDAWNGYAFGVPGEIGWGLRFNITSGTSSMPAGNWTEITCASADGTYASGTPLTCSDGVDNAMMFCPGLSPSGGVVLAVDDEESSYSSCVPITLSIA